MPQHETSHRLDAPARPPDDGIGAVRRLLADQHRAVDRYSRALQFCGKDFILPLCKIRRDHLEAENLLKSCLHERRSGTHADGVQLIFSFLSAIPWLIGDRALLRYLEREELSELDDCRLALQREDLPEGWSGILDRELEPKLRLGVETLRRLLRDA